MNTKLMMESNDDESKSDRMLSTFELSTCPYTNKKSNSKNKQNNYEKAKDLVWIYSKI